MVLQFAIEDSGGFLNQYPEGAALDEMIFKGFYPRIYDQDISPAQVYGDYFETYIERDLRQPVNVKNLSLFQRFVTLCAGRAGQLLNLSNLADDTGISHSTAREWLTVLQASYIVYLLPPFYRNIKKRLVKSPKLYFYDNSLPVPFPFSFFIFFQIQDNVLGLIGI